MCVYTHTHTHTHTHYIIYGLRWAFHVDFKSITEIVCETWVSLKINKDRTLRSIFRLSLTTKATVASNERCLSTAMAAFTNVRLLKGACRRHGQILQFYICFYDLPGISFTDRCHTSCELQTHLVRWKTGGRDTLTRSHSLLVLFQMVLV